MTSAAKFWDRIAARYAKSPVTDAASYARKLELTRGYLHPDMNVLELGCGTGSTAIEHAPRVRHIHAVDVSANMLEIARQKAAAANVTNISFETAAVEDFRAPPGSFDAVLALNLLHLVRDRTAVFDMVSEMLVPGGIFVTSTPCLADGLGLLKFVLPLPRLLGFVPYVAFFTAAGLREELGAAGFVVEEVFQPGKNKALFLIARKS